MITVDAEEEAARQRRLTILIAIVVVVWTLLAASNWWFERRSDERVRDATAEIEEFFADGAAQWHADAAAELRQPWPFDDPRPALWAAQSLESASATSIGGQVGTDDMELIYEVRSFPDRRCIRVVVTPAGDVALAERECR